MKRVLVPLVAAIFLMTGCASHAGQLDPSQAANGAASYFGYTLQPIASVAAEQTNQMVLETDALVTVMNTFATDNESTTALIGCSTLATQGGQWAKDEAAFVATYGTTRFNPPLSQTASVLVSDLKFCETHQQQ